MTTQFKTNFKCGGCVAAVKEILDKNPNIQKWDVDLQSEDRVLTVEWKIDESETVIKQIINAGFKISKK